MQSCDEAHCLQRNRCIARNGVVPRNGDEYISDDIQTTYQSARVITVDTIVSCLVHAHRIKQGRTVVDIIKMLLRVVGVIDHKRS